MNANATRVQFVILAPQETGTPGSPLNQSYDENRHARLLSDMQRLRGRVALREGAIVPSMLDSSMRYRMAGDEDSWHLLRLREGGQVSGCARILVHPPNVKFPRLRIASSSVARSSIWAHHVKRAVESELAHARLNDLTTIEPGGWVVDEDLRGTCEAVSLAIAAFAWAQVLGNCIGFLTATVKHGSATILRRLGGRNLQAEGETIPGYFEPAWGCKMELLRFDTDSLNPRFEASLCAARAELNMSPVLYPDRHRSWISPSSICVNSYANCQPAAVVN